MNEASHGDSFAKCQGTDACCNPLTQTADEDSDDEMNI
jgi:hypothetical protein